MSVPQTGWHRPGRRMFAVAALLGVVGLPALATTPAPPSPGAPPPPAVPSAPPAADRGGLLYGQRCASCHGLRGEGTQRGPSLAGVGQASVDFQLGTGRMPLTTEQYEPLHRHPAFSPADIEALVGYVAGFGAGGPPIPAVQPTGVQRGLTLYADHCAACHSASGVGATLSNGQIAPPLMPSTPTQVAEAIRVGPGLMPAFPDTVLDDRDVAAIAAYVQVLRNQHGNLDRGGLALGRLGPFTEGAVAWIIGLGLLVVVIRRLAGRAR